MAVTSLLSGEVELADREATAAFELSEQFNQPVVTSMALSVRALAGAMQGEKDRALSDGARSIEIAGVTAWPWSDAFVRWARALVALADDDPRRAWQELGDTASAVEQLGVFELPLTWSLPDAIEALVAIGDVERASRLADQLEDWGRRFDRQWARAVALRGHSLIASAEGRTDDAKRLGTAAIAEHEGLPMAWDFGRTSLAVGQVRRRLFIAARTVEANLSRAYRKLRIVNRAQLGVALVNARND